MRITTAFVAVTLASVVIVEAQPSPPAETAWSRVSFGDTVTVTGKDSSELQGKYEHVVDGRLTLRVNGQIREILLADTQQVAKHGDSLRSGFLIGAALGVALGMTSPFLPCPYPPCSIPLNVRIRFAGLGGLMYGGIGALIDRAIPGRTVVFRFGPKAAEVSFVPMVLPQQRGLLMSLGFD